MRTEAREMLAIGIIGRKSRLSERIELLVRRGRTFSPRVSAASFTAIACIIGPLALAGSSAPDWIAFAQEPGAASPAFEVASVKRDTSSVQTMYGRPVGDRFTATNTSLKALIALAYKVHASEIFGGPGWVESERYDISARAAQSKISDAQFRLMLQALLTERFRLTAHRETREEPVYNLILASKNRIEGHGSRDGGCTPFVPGSSPPLPPGAPPACGALFVAPNRLEGSRINPATMTRTLADLLGRPVIDKTDYAEAFDFQLKFKAEGVAAWGPGGFGRPELSGGADESALPTIFTALEDDLGLKLESAKAPVEVLVVDHVEKADAN